MFRNCENKYRKFLGVVDRFWKERLTTGNAMCIVLVYASGKYTAATCPTLTLVLLRSLMPLFIRSLSLFTVSPIKGFLIRKCDPLSLAWLITESETRDSEMLPTVGGKHNEEMLGPESRQASGDGGGSEATRGSRHKQRRGNDTTRQVSGVPLFLQTSWPLISLPWLICLRAA